MRAKGFLEPRAGLERTLYALAASSGPSAYINGYKEWGNDPILYILLFWWIVCSYWTILWLLRHMKVLHYLFIKRTFRD